MSTEKVSLLKQNEAEMYFKDIKKLIIDSRNNLHRTVNVEMLSLYWNIGKIIMEIQEGKERDSYGETILEEVSIKLTEEFGKEFSKRNLRRMRRFYCLFPIWPSVMTKLTWTHYLVITGIGEEYKRNFYMKETIISK